MTVHLLVPEGFDDPARPSGGNYYDRRIAEGLTRLGWQVCVQPVAGCWPRLGGVEVTEVTAEIPDDSVVLVDGIIVSAMPQVLVSAARRLRLVVLVHMLPENQLEREVLWVADSIVTTSRWTREKLLAEYGLEAGCVHVAHPGVDSAELARGSPEGRQLLCVATVAEHKGHDLLLDALDRIAELSWHCTLAGPLDREPVFVDRLRQQLHTSRIAGRVTFTGALDTDAVSKKYATADLLVLASRGETYGMVICEALARGVPVLASEVGGIPEAVGTAADGTSPGLFVPPGDAGALAAELARWLQDSQLRHRLRSAARDRRSSLPTWQATTERVAEVLAG
ncbi:glycosyltransferase family 4 protein [Hoyosella altamirensis]|uniref:Glycosyltransferase involved in cell wall biosynthesis n=1 Tax=Hoyosella altamirensis TaxID=616997 RepID=A0A839RH27_9ACTN|nr:glycosyltransferase family 4 protein [Hoyosella altamirensis]MBB3035720.1 glycosyltransferase involved in cell wall biosynthesis [Hoyosella altamirensis]